MAAGGTRHPVRNAQVCDLPRLMRYAQAFHAYHPLTAHAPFDAEPIEAKLKDLIAGGDAVLLVHDHGAIGGVLAPIWCAPSVVIATEIFWWAERDGRSLMKAFEAWAEGKGADEVQMIAILGARDVTPIYDRAGYRPVELCFMKAA